MSVLRSPMLARLVAPIKCYGCLYFFLSFGFTMCMCVCLRAFFFFVSFEKCSLRSFDNRNYVIAHLLVCISFAHTTDNGRVFLFRSSTRTTETKLWAWTVCKYDCHFFLSEQTRMRITICIFAEPLVKHDSMDVNRMCSYNTYTHHTHNTDYS